MGARLPRPSFVRHNGVTMYTPDERQRLRAELLERAARDSRISGAAITGSAVENREDAWSDVDLAFGVAHAAHLPDVLSDWTAHMYGERRAVHHMDVIHGAWTYRVFLLASTLQVDLAFAPANEFRPLSPAFRLISGAANEARPAPAPSVAETVGWAWLYALHARSAIARAKPWQAEYMISGVRDSALALACIRHGLPAIYAKGVDGLPAEVAAPFADALVRSLEPLELSRAFRAAIDRLLVEIRAADPELADRLKDVLIALSCPGGAPGRHPALTEPRRFSKRMHNQGRQNA